MTTQNTQNTAPQNPFKKAERKRAWIKVALTGPSGSGKTMSALKLLRGFLGPDAKIAFIDTENDSASLYADVTDFDAVNLQPPYTIQKYVAAIQAAVANKYDGLIIDTISHAWAGEGGLLEQKEQLDSRTGKGERNKFGNWAQISKQHENFKSWLLKAPVHMICTMRSKQDYVLAEGGAKVQKVGMGPVQREGMEYEFTTVLDIAMDHSAAPSKDRTNVFNGKIVTLSEEHGQQLREWHQSGTDAKAAPAFEAPAPAAKQNPVKRQAPAPAAWKATEADYLKLEESMGIGGYSREEAQDLLRKLYGATSSRALNQQQFKDFCSYMERNPNDAAPSPPAGAPGSEQQGDLMPEDGDTGDTFEDFEPPV